MSGKPPSCFGMKHVQYVIQTLSMPAAAGCAASTLCARTCLRIRPHVSYNVSVLRILLFDVGSAACLYTYILCSAYTVSFLIVPLSNVGG